ncbi:MAG: hypothetical protein COZ75_01180 [Flavobacteriaceae bacterium CG_4_8_14_3_um_filter_34_10]|nr:hypothetical protein [Flavobacteriia bacterium]OIP49851.1 MAG: hypothetical protein AUK33_09310 [Flavobacteriaceae bacterium CG2_30_34_30]PIQ18915.1 MAG: hypothetical protein COW66_03915 [Flavobacteriaceae bacterium CG18_big_fil_WC_8_21_14_2_50_34_36]PIV48968.1 MAG: hypothetical protein COS19_11095 [Flavobacteriaceae bacterium CG02_land_8_20_14_3_00_34_13]PIX10502.1 MAG: hypothetical protein COZ75_01180 [Flavobacteriaceae bacterium CG_4_8_14_3_um_filter_34_10]PIZ08628.1 MAG: hypothetical pr
MKIEHLEERINEYKTSIQTVIEKRILWDTKIKTQIFQTLKKVENTYLVGWKVQELKWIHTNEAININFDSFPPELMEMANGIPSFQFLQGGSLVFSQLHNGDINVFVLFPIVENTVPLENEIEDLGIFTPKEITEKLIVEKVDEFLKQMIQWEVPLAKSKVGFKNQ